MSMRIGQIVDVAAVRERAREDWERAQKGKLSIQEKIGFSVPWWIVILAVTLFTLSIPHTMSVFAQITPTFGYVAPFGIEFGLLYYAFRTKQESGRVPWTLHALGALFFVTAIIVNAAGSLQAVVSIDESTRNMPAQELIYSFAKLPAKSQVALLLVPVAALFIPIGTLATGEGLATLFLQYDERTDTLSKRWERVRATVEFEALQAAALTAGVTANQAAKWAAAVVKRPLSSAPDMSAYGQTDMNYSVREGETDAAPDTGADSGGHGSGYGYSKNMDARTLVWQHLADNPDDVYLSVRALADMVGVGKTVAHEVREEWRASSNGHRQADG